MRDRLVLRIPRDKYDGHWLRARLESRLPALESLYGEIEFRADWQEFGTYDLDSIDGVHISEYRFNTELLFPQFVLLTTRLINSHIELRIEVRPFKEVIFDFERNVDRELSRREQRFVNVVKHENIRVDRHIRGLVTDIVADLLKTHTGFKVVHAGGWFGDLETGRQGEERASDGLGVDSSPSFDPIADEISGQMGAMTGVEGKTRSRNEPVSRSEPTFALEPASASVQAKRATKAAPKPPRVPMRQLDRNKWRACWLKIRPEWRRGKNYEEIREWLNAQDSSLEYSTDVLAEIIKAGEAGLLDQDSPNISP